MPSLAGLWRKIILYRLQKQLFPQRWEAFSVHLRQYSLLQNPTVLLEGPARKDVHGWTQCYPSVSSKHHILKHIFYIRSVFTVHLLCLHTDMCPGTSMRQYRGSTTSQEAKIWSIFWIWRIRQVFWSSCVPDRTSVQSGKWWKMELLNCTVVIKFVHTDQSTINDTLLRKCIKPKNDNVAL